MSYSSVSSAAFADRSRPPVGRVLFWLAFVLISLLALDQGVELRRWAWQQTRPIRFGDIHNGYKYGYRAAKEGYLDLYDQVIVETRRTQRSLDYVPLRLLTMRCWVASMMDDFPQGRWRPEYEFTAWVLKFNIAMELLAAIGLCLLTSQAIQRAWAAQAIDLQARPPTIKAWSLGLLAALMFWFNPAVILSAHGWPTWDIWIVPFFVWGLYFASIDRWLLAGMGIGLGTMFKGQQLIVAPLFLLWPIFQGRFGAAARFFVGLTFACALVVAVWMLRFPPDPVRLEQVARWGLRYRQNNGYLNAPPAMLASAPSLRLPGEPIVNWPAIQWIIALAIGMLMVAISRLAPRLKRWRYSIMLLAIFALLWHCPLWVPGLSLVSPEGWFAKLLWDFPLATGYVLAIVPVMLMAIWPKKSLGVVWAACMAGALFLCIPLFNASTGWYEIGWKFGTVHWQWMVMGKTDNIPGLLAMRFGYPNQQSLLETCFTIPAKGLWLWPTGDWPVTFKTLFVWIYGLLLVVSSWMTARFYRRGDARYLLAAIAPWLFMFTVLGQIHERYLLYFAAASVCLIAVSWRWIVMQLFLTAVTFVMTIHVMISGAENWFRTNPPDAAIWLTRETARQWFRWANATHPDLAWGVIVCAGLVLCAMLACPQKRPVSLDRSKP